MALVDFVDISSGTSNCVHTQRTETYPTPWAKANINEGIKIQSWWMTIMTNSSHTHPNFFWSYLWIIIFRLSHAWHRNGAIIHLAKMNNQVEVTNVRHASAPAVCFWPWRSRHLIGDKGLEFLMAYVWRNAIAAFTDSAFSHIQPQSSFGYTNFRMRICCEVTATRCHWQWRTINISKNDTVLGREVCLSDTLSHHSCVRS